MKHCTSASSVNEYPRPGRQHGGIGRKIQVIARRFVAEGHRISVVGLYPRSDQWDDRGVTVSELQHAAGFRGARFVRNRAVVRRKLLELAAEQELDLVEFQDGNSPLIPLNLGVPVVVRFSLAFVFCACSGSPPQIPPGPSRALLLAQG